MAFYDILEDVSKRQIEKTETGDSRIMGVMLGEVVNNYNQQMPGRVAVKLLSREETPSDDGSNSGGGGGGEENTDAARILWAKMVMLSGGSSWGHYFIPENGDLVLVAFEQGNIERAYIIGCVPKTKDKIISKSIDEMNQFKKIVTRNGSAVIFEDYAEKSEGEEGGGGGGGGGGDEPGAKDKITVITAGSAHKILLDNENKLIQITDKEGKNFVKLNTDEDKGHIEVTAAKKMTVKVGDNITVTLNGSSGAVTIKAQKVQIQTDDAMSVESQGRAEFKGTNVTLEGSSMLKLSSSGPAQLSGTPVKLG
ncbi:MAG: phage baseplate assembly protein V [Lachnospiraceae bacterium]|nr:phage baseplate assembly protein V [Lachnospiraceae bacterium]